MDGLVIYEVNPNATDKLRELYYSIFDKAARDEGLNLNRFGYAKVVLEEEKKRLFSKRKVVAVVESDSPLGALDDLTNENTVGGLNNRKYEGLEIYLLDDKYMDQVNSVARIIGGITNRPAKVSNRARSREAILNEIRPKWKK